MSRILLFRITQYLSIGAGEGNRTLVVSLEGFCSTIELHPHSPKLLLTTNVNPLIRSHVLRPQTASWWRGLDSNQRRRKPTGLQPVPFSHSGTPPCKIQVGEETNVRDTGKGFSLSTSKHGKITSSPKKSIFRTAGYLRLLIE